MLSLPDFSAKKWIIVNPLEGQKLSIKNDNIIVSDEENKILLQISCFRVYTVWILGSTTLTTVLLERAKKFGFSIFLLNSNLRTIGQWNAATEGNFVLRRKQYHFEDLNLSKRIVKNKLENQIALLKTIRSKSSDLKNDLLVLSSYMDSIDKSEQNDSLLGLEGVAAKLFFKHWYEDLDWKGRKPRAKTDPINVLLDIGYTILFNFIDSLLDLYGFDKYCGFYHKAFYQRKSLVCDLVEPFRCIIDKQVLKSFRLNQIKIEDFEIYKHQYKLKFQKNKDVQKFFIPALMEEREEIFKYIQSFYRAFMREKPIEDYPIFSFKT